MGARLVTQALSPSWAGLSDHARLVLVRMCQTALDEPSESTAPALFFSGHASILTALTGLVPEDRAEREREWASASRRLRRAIAELVEAGAIHVVEEARAGRHATYLVTPGRTP